MKIRQLFLSDGRRSIPPAAVVLNLLLVCAVLAVVFWLSLRAIGYVFDFSFLGEVRVRLWRGLVMTLALSLCSLVLSLVLGALCAVGQSARVLFVRYLCSVYVKFIRGTPLMMQIYLFFYLLGTA